MLSKNFFISANKPWIHIERVSGKQFVRIIVGQCGRNNNNSAFLRDIFLFSQQTTLVGISNPTLQCKFCFWSFRDGFKKAPWIHFEIDCHSSLNFLILEKIRNFFPRRRELLNMCHSFSDNTCSILKELVKTVVLRISNCIVKSYLRYNELQGSDRLNKLLFTNTDINNFLKLVFNDNSILLRLCNRINGVHRITILTRPDFGGINTAKSDGRCTTPLQKMWFFWTEWTPLKTDFISIIPLCTSTVPLCR